MIAEWSKTDMRNVVYLLSVILIGWFVIRLVSAIRRRRVATENRHWSYCPRCGWPRPGERMASADPSVRPERNGASHAGPVSSGDVHRATRIETPQSALPDCPALDGTAACCGPEPPKPIMPSGLLRRGWSMLLAENSDGDMIPPNDSRVCAWSIYGAGFCAFPEGSAPFRAYFRHITELVRERYGRPSIGDWNMDSRRNICEVVGVALEAERRMRAESVIPDDPDSRTR